MGSGERFRGWTPAREVFPIRTTVIVFAMAAVLAGTVAAIADAKKPTPRPTVATGGASAISQTSATVSGTVNPNGSSTSYYFDFGTSTAYGSRTGSQAAGSGTTSAGISANLSGLTGATTYHYRLVASNCGGCGPGTSYGADQTFTTSAAGPSPPVVATGGASAVTQTSATVSGTVNPRGQSSTYYFNYGTTSAYGSHTTSQGAGSGTTSVAITGNLTGLSPGTTYHYQLVASNGAGTSYGADQTFTTSPTAEQTAANRAIATYQAMQRYFYAANVYSGDTSALYVETYPQSGKKYAYLWPFSRALVGTLTLSGIPSSLLGASNYGSDVSDRLSALAHYWDGTSTGPGYDSYVPAPYGGGGDKYYDDQAWIGLALAQHYQLTRATSSLNGAENVFNFVYPGGWDGKAGDFDSGGVYWVQQGVGMGLTNHDRTTTSNAPNAELGFLLENLDSANASKYDTGATKLYGWVNHYLYNVNANPTDPNAPNPNYDSSQPAIIFDKVRGDNTIDKTHWTYNQGTMIAANVLEYLQTGQSAYLSNAEALANTSLSTFSESDFVSTQSAAFNAIYFRGLLLLYSATGDATLKSKILQTIRTYADDAWNNYRDSQNRFNFRSSSTSSDRLLDQGAMLEIYSALAWNASDYPKLP